MIIAPDGYERFPILVSPLTITEMMPLIPRPEHQTVSPVEGTERTNLESRARVLSGGVSSNNSGASFTDRRGRDNRFINNALIAGSTPSDRSLILLSQPNRVRPSAAQVSAVYDSTNARLDAAARRVVR